MRMFILNIPTDEEKNDDNADKKKGEKRTMKKRVEKPE